MTFAKSIATAALYIAMAVGANASMLEPPKALTGLMIHEDIKPALTAEFTGPDGAMTLADIGQPLTVFNFWATWCAPCVHEMPSLSALRAASGDDFEVITVATGRNTEASLERFFEETGIDNLPLHLDPRQELAREAAVLGLPVTLILNAEGREIARYQGDTDWSDPEIIEFLKALAVKN